MSIFSLSVFG